MTTILRMLFPALEPATSTWIVGLTLATTAALAFLIGLARRRHSYWWLPMAMPAVGFSAIAFVLRAITPGTDVPAAKVMEHFLAYETISASCFVAAVGILAAITRLARRSLSSHTVSFVTTIALLVTVAVSAFSAATLRDTSARFRDAARYGRDSAIER